MIFVYCTSFFGFRVFLVDGLQLVYGQQHWVPFRFATIRASSAMMKCSAVRITSTTLESIQNLEFFGRIFFWAGSSLMERLYRILYAVRMCVMMISVLFCGGSLKSLVTCTPQKFKIACPWKVTLQKGKLSSNHFTVALFRGSVFLVCWKLQCCIAWGSLWCPGIGSSTRSCWICGRFPNEHIPHKLAQPEHFLSGGSAGVTTFVAPSCMFCSSEHERYTNFKSIARTYIWRMNYEYIICRDLYLYIYIYM